jgi:methanogenic corrinoid protein MtbC1
LRAWEHRYSLLSPHRSSGGFRLYSADDEARVRAMLKHLDRGVAAAQAAELARGAQHARRAIEPAEARAALTGAVAGFDEVAADATFDAALASLGLERTLGDVIYPFLTDVGAAWECGHVTVGEEHFASHWLTGRLVRLAENWTGTAAGPSAVLACPAGERHTLGLLGFGLLLRREGWRITFLGADTPLPPAADAARASNADVVVLAATMPHVLPMQLDALRALASGCRVVVGGPAASAPVLADASIPRCADDLITAARALGSNLALQPI